MWICGHDETRLAPVVVAEDLNAEVGKFSNDELYLNQFNRNRDKWGSSKSLQELVRDLLERYLNKF